MSGTVSGTFGEAISDFLYTIDQWEFWQGVGIIALLLILTAPLRFGLYRLQRYLEKRHEERHGKPPGCGCFIVQALIVGGLMIGFFYLSQSLG